MLFYFFRARNESRREGREIMYLIPILSNSEERDIFYGSEREQNIEAMNGIDLILH